MRFDGQLRTETTVANRRHRGPNPVSFGHPARPRLRLGVASSARANIASQATPRMCRDMIAIAQCRRSEQPERDRIVAGLLDTLVTELAKPGRASNVGGVIDVASERFATPNRDAEPTRECPVTSALAKWEPAGSNSRPTASKYARVVFQRTTANCFGWSGAVRERARMTASARWTRDGVPAGCTTPTVWWRPCSSPSRPKASLASTT